MSRQAFKEETVVTREDLIEAILLEFFPNKYVYTRDEKGTSYLHGRVRTPSPNILPPPFWTKRGAHKAAHKRGWRGRQYAVVKTKFKKKKVIEPSTGRTYKGSQMVVKLLDPGK